MIFFFGLLCCPTSDSSAARFRSGSDRSSAPDSHSSCSESDHWSTPGTGDPGHDSDFRSMGSSHFVAEKVLAEMSTVVDKWTRTCSQSWKDGMR